jgi:hypothetical protein
MKNILTLFAIMMITSTSINAQQKEFGWLIGKWKLKGKPVYEVWRLDPNGPGLIGLGYKIQGRDTIIVDKIQLKKIDRDFFYIPDVPENKAPVFFKITRQTANSFTAENPLHDFPKIIRYQWLKKESQEFIDAAIEGDGKTIPYNFEKAR